MVVNKGEVKERFYVLGAKGSAKNHLSTVTSLGFVEEANVVDPQRCSAHQFFCSSDILFLNASF